MTDSEPMKPNDPKDTPKAAFELEGDEPSSSDAAVRALEAHRASGENDDSVFGLDEEDEDTEAGAVPPELAEGEPEEEIPAEGAEVPSLEAAGGEDTRSGQNGSGDDAGIPLILDMEEAKRIIETLLFATHQPLRPRDIAMVFRGVENVNAKVVRKLLAELVKEYEGRTLQIAEIGEGFRMCTRLEFSPWMRRFLKQERKWRVSNAGVETLAIVAYKQPITKIEVEEIRRVDCGGVIHTLLERSMIRILGRRDVVGKPIVYGTTPQFLEHFGFKSLTDMPNPEELDLDIDLEGASPAGDVISIESGGGGYGDAAQAGEDSGEHHTRGHANGSSNGHANGSANGHAAAGENGLEKAVAAAETDEESEPPEES